MCTKESVAQMGARDAQAEPSAEERRMPRPVPELGGGSFRYLCGDGDGVRGVGVGGKVGRPSLLLLVVLLGWFGLHQPGPRRQAVCCREITYLSTYRGWR